MTQKEKERNSVFNRNKNNVYTIPYIYLLI